MQIVQIYLLQTHQMEEIQEDHFLREDQVNKLIFNFKYIQKIQKKKEGKNKLFTKEER